MAAASAENKGVADVAPAPNPERIEYIAWMTDLITRLFLGMNTTHGGDNLRYWLKSGPNAKLTPLGPDSGKPPPTAIFHYALHSLLPVGASMKQLTERQVGTALRNVILNPASGQWSQIGERAIEYLIDIFSNYYRLQLPKRKWTAAGPAIRESLLEEVGQNEIDPTSGWALMRAGRPADFLGFGGALRGPTLTRTEEELMELQETGANLHLLPNIENLDDASPETRAYITAMKEKQKELGKDLAKNEAQKTEEVLQAGLEAMTRALQTKGLDTTKIEGLRATYMKNGNNYILHRMMGLVGVDKKRRDEVINILAKALDPIRDKETESKRNLLLGITRPEDGADDEFSNPYPSADNLDDVSGGFRRYRAEDNPYFRQAMEDQYNIDEDLLTDSQDRSERAGIAKRAALTKHRSDLAQIMHYKGQVKKAIAAKLKEASKRKDGAILAGEAMLSMIGLGETVRPESPPYNYPDRRGYCEAFLS